MAHDWPVTMHSTCTSQSARRQLLGGVLICSYRRQHQQQHAPLLQSWPICARPSVLLQAYAVEACEAALPLLRGAGPLAGLKHAGPTSLIHQGSGVSVNSDYKLSPAEIEALKMAEDGNLPDLPGLVVAATMQYVPGIDTGLHAWHACEQLEQRSCSLKWPDCLLTDASEWFIGQFLIQSRTAVQSARHRHIHFGEHVS